MERGSEAESEEEEGSQEDEDDDGDSDSENPSGNGVDGEGTGGADEDAAMTTPTSLRLTVNNPLFDPGLDVDAIANIINGWHSQHDQVVSQWIERQRRDKGEVRAMEKDFRRTLSWLQQAGVEAGDQVLAAADLDLGHLDGYLSNLECANEDKSDLKELETLLEQLQGRDGERVNRERRSSKRSKEGRMAKSS